MTKVYPNANANANANAMAAATSERVEESDGNSVVVLTVWKKSLMFNCDGFTVFDDKGNLVFRVDNYYSSGSKAEIVLMDASGKSLLTIRRKKLSLADNYLVFNGETAVNPIFSARKHTNFLSNTKCILAHVSSGGGGGGIGSGSGSGSPKSKNGGMYYEIEGSYTQRSCAVYNDRKKRVAEIRRKESVGGVVLGTDVFRLIVNPQMDSAVAMALVILLDKMFGSSRHFST